MAIFLNDDFNRTSPAFLHGSTASTVGGVWSAVASSNGTGSPAMPGGHAALSGDITLFHQNSAAPASADYTVPGVFTAVADNWQFALLSRIQPDGSYYQFFLSPGGARIDRKTSSDGTIGTQIGASSTNVSIPAGDRTAHTLTFTVNGPSLSATVDGVAVQFGSGITTLTDSTITAAGVAGMGGRQANIDSLVGDTLGGGGGGDTTAPIITGPGGAQGATSSASVTAGATAVHTFTANEPVTWDLNGGANAALFSIGSSTGALVYNAPATAGTHVVVVRATDTATPTANTTSQTVTVTVSAGGDTTNPTLTGSITVSALTSTSYTLTWPAGSDNVAVTGYEVSLNGGTSYTPVGNVLTTNITGRTPSSTDAVRVRAFDAAGYRSTPALSASVTLNSASTGTLTLTAPLCNNTGEISGLWSNQTGIRLSVVNESTGTTVLVVTGRATDASGVLTAAVTDAAIVTGQTYRILPSWSGNAGLSQVLTAT